jgi:histidinol-phosphate/aromatic aminotransferase/cobyric acid decarboxylase-like protein
VIIDEAYAEFAGGTWITEAPTRDRLLVTRTLSKAFGMAGFRIGYGTGTASLIHEIEKVRGPYKENAPAERAAAAALREDVAWMRDTAAQAVANRERFAQTLRSSGFQPLPSAANFLLLPLPDAAVVAQRMRAQGVAVRPYPGLPGIGDAVRITIGPWPVMELALAALLAAREAARSGDAEAAAGTGQ